MNERERADLKTKLEGMGVQLDEYLYHRVKGGGLHLHIAATHVPQELYAQDAPLSDDDSENPTPLAPTANPERPAVSRKAPSTDGPGFFDMPDSWSQLGEGLALGAGNIVEGIGDTLGIVANPANVLMARAMGYDNYTPDFGKTLRESMGLPGDEGLTGDVIKGIAGGASFSGGAKLAAKAVQSAVAKRALVAMGETPVRDAVAGGGAALGAGIAEREGAPVPVQLAAALAAGATGALGIERAAAKGAQFLDSPAGGKLLPDIAQRRFLAQQAKNRLSGYDREISQDVSDIVKRLPLGKQGLRKAEQATFLARIDELETAYLPYSEIKSSSLSPSAKAKFKKALDDRHVLSDADIAALEDGTAAGLAVADSLRKVRRLRSTLPSVVDKSDPKIASFLKEALGSTAASSLGHAVGGPVAGSVMGVLGARAAKGFRRPEADLIAAKVEELVEQSRKFALMPDETMNGGRAKAKEALAKLKQDADTTLDKPYLAKLAMKKLEDEGRKVAIKNAQDDIVPQGGFRGYLYAQTGLKPSAQDAAALAVLKDGKITPQQFDMFLNDPEKLMHGKVGLSLSDRFAAMADEGQIQRDPDWIKPELPASQVAPQSLDAQGQPIRSVEAYRAGAARNTTRELDLMRELDTVDPVVATFGEGESAFAVRLSEDTERSMDEAARTRAAAIRLELANMKQPRGKAAQ